MRKAWIFIVLWSAFNWSASQSYVNYSEKDGLPSNHVYKITQDVDGFIWIATDEGLVKYNGHDFKIFTTKDGLPTNDIYNMYPAKDGKLWYVSKSTSLGYIFKDVVYDFKTKKEGDGLNPNMTGFTGNEIIPSNSYISHILNGNQWEEINYNKSSNYLNQQYLIHNRFKGIVVSAKKMDGFYLITKEDQYVKLNVSDFNPKNYYRMQITDSLFVSLSSTNYSFINLNNLESYSFSYQQQLGVSKLMLNRIHLANDEIQISGENVVCILGEDLTSRKTVHIPKHLKSHFSFIDKENTLWIATFTNGFYRYSLNDINIKTEHEHYKIRDVKKVKNEIFALVNEKGFYKYDLSTDHFNVYLEDRDFLYNAQYLSETNTSYFISSSRIQFGKGKSPIKSVTTNEFYDVTGRSLAYYKGFIYGYNTFGITKSNSKSLKPLTSYQLNSVRSLINFKDRLIIGVSNGLYQLKNNEIVKIDALSNFKKPVIDLLPLNDDQLLVCTDGYGIYSTDLKTIKLLEGSEFLKANNPCYSDNELYIPTNKGIYHYVYEDHKMVLKKIWNNTSGLPTNKINGVEKLDDKLLVATNQGIIHFPIDYENKQRLQDIYVESLTYDIKNLSKNSSVKYITEGDLQVTVNSIDYRSNSDFNYDFRLLPTKTDWTRTSSSNLRFADLSPDNYQLELRSEGIKKCYEFKIVPLWYQTWWFYVCCGLVSIGFIVWITRHFSKKSQEKKNRELLQSQQLSDLQLKALRSQMNPHFVFNSLNAIQYYINENDIETSDRYLVKFSRLVREFFELSKEQHIKIEREIDLLKNYLDLEKLRFKSKFDYNIRVDPTLDLKEELPSMLLQPLVENAVNHGIFNRPEKGFIHINFEKTTINQLKITIQDNGLGYHYTNEESRYKSSSVLDERIKYLKNSGSWEIDVERSTPFKDLSFPGHQVTFNLKKITDENL